MLICCVARLCVISIGLRNRSSSCIITIIIYSLESLVCLVCVITLRASETAAQCNVIGHVCLFVGVCVCVCVCVCGSYHDNSKLHASILTKLGLYR